MPLEAGDLKCVIRTFLLRKFNTGLDCRKVDIFKDSLIEFSRIIMLHATPSIAKTTCESLNTKANGAVAHIGTTGFLGRIEVNVNNTIQITRRYWWLPCAAQQSQRRRCEQMQEEPAEARLQTAVSCLA
jgi:hypothetical protein